MQSQNALVAGELLAGKPEDLEALITELLAVLGRSGRNVQRDGHPVTDPADRRHIVAQAVATILEKRLPVLRRLGVLDAQVKFPLPSAASGGADLMH
jgi:hypothetical protein